MAEVNLSMAEDKIVEIPKFAYAGFWIRFLAYMIDMVVIDSVTRIINGLFFSDLNLELAFNLSPYKIIHWLVIFLYFFLMTYITKGQTLGKMACGIRVISIENDNLGFFQVLVREVFGRYIQTKILILYLIVAFTPNKQSLVDMLCDTVVVKNDVVKYVTEN